MFYKTAEKASPKAGIRTLLIPGLRQDAFVYAEVSRTKDFEKTCGSDAVSEVRDDHDRRQDQDRR